jgi:protein-disulfide isomerase
MRKTIIAILLAFVAGFAGAATYMVSGLAGGQIEGYLLANPDLLPRMASAWERQQAEDRLAAAGGEVRQPFPGAVLGNPNGSRTLVKFTDYNCGYCRASAAEVAKMIARDPELKVVVREWPIFQGSQRAASWALAAGQQGKFEPFYTAMFEDGDTSEAGLLAAAEKAGLDVERLRRDAASPAIAVELSRNGQLARELGFTGTPSWIAGDQIIEGAVPASTLIDALDADSGDRAGA